MNLVKRLWQTHRLLLIAFTVAAALTLFFAIRTTAFFIYWSNHQNVEIEGWMTIGYVAHSYRRPKSCRRPWAMIRANRSGGRSAVSPRRPASRCPS